MNPAEIDQCYVEAEGDTGGEEEEMRGEDQPDDEDQIPGGGGTTDRSLLPADPEAGHFQAQSGPVWAPGVSYHPTDLAGPQEAPPREEHCHNPTFCLLFPQKVPVLLLSHPGFLSGQV